MAVIHNYVWCATLFIEMIHFLITTHVRLEWILQYALVFPGTEAGRQTQVAKAI